MPPRQQVSKFTASPGPSGEGQKSSSGREKQANNQEGLQKQRVKANKPLLSSEHKEWIYVAHVRFRYNGRPLERDETSKITAMMLGMDTVPGRALVPLLDKFDNPEDEVTIEHETNAIEHEQDLLIDVERKFITYRQEDEDAKDRCRNLEGLTKRLPKLALQSALKWGHKAIRHDQLFLCYALSHFCKDHRGKRLGLNVGNAVLLEKIFHGRPGPKAKIFETFEREDDRTTKVIAEAMNEDQLYVEHFGRRAYEMFKEYESARGHQEPLLVIPSASQSDLGSTTTGVEGLSLTATASSSNQLTAAGPRQLNEPNTQAETPFSFSTWLNSDAGASPEVSESSDQESKGKGKGKQRRERDSSSNSPGKGKSGRPEEKKRRREGKS